MRKLSEQDWQNILEAHEVGAIHRILAQKYKISVQAIENKVWKKGLGRSWQRCSKDIRIYTGLSAYTETTNPIVKMLIRESIFPMFYPDESSYPAYLALMEDVMPYEFQLLTSTEFEEPLKQSSLEGLLTEELFAGEPQSFKDAIKELRVKFVARFISNYDKITPGKEKKKIDLAIATLSGKYSRIIELYYGLYGEKLSRKKIAEIIGMTHQGIGYAIKSSLKKIKDFLETH